LTNIKDMTPQEAEDTLLAAGFETIRSEGGHRMYIRGERRVVVPFLSDGPLHPKIARRVLRSAAPA
jgi:predicted RNA binding protein YcfA (HicA-like mRNA interferase family)